jgi:hypothetical protein
LKLQFFQAVRGPISLELLHKVCFHSTRDGGGDPPGPGLAESYGQMIAAFIVTFSNHRLFPAAFSGAWWKFTFMHFQSTCNLLSSVFFFSAIKI